LASDTSAGVADAFGDRFGHAPEGVWRAPGRVNLIGEHTDYNAGLSLPFAIDRHVVVAGARSPDGVVRGWSAQEGGDIAGWGAYPRGVLSAFREAGIDVPSVELAVDSDVPLGAGLASSAALLAAVAMAVDGLAEAGVSRRRLAELCHQAESRFVGVPVGMLDPLAVLCGRQDHGLLIDFGDLSVEALPLPPAMGPFGVVDTGVRHRLGDGAYAERRRQCEEAATRLGVPDLRSATLEDVEHRLDGVLRRRARHVVTENQRVIEAARRLRAGGADLGDLLWASHASLRDDFEVSCPELDAVVVATTRAGARGARVTGAGFGGCAIVVGLALQEVVAALARDPVVAGGATAFAVTPSAGAARVA